MDKSDEELLAKFKEQRAKQYARQYKYNANAYDRLSIFVPKGFKSDIEAHAREQGFKSINSYINDLINKDMQL